MSLKNHFQFIKTIAFIGIAFFLKFILVDQVLEETSLWWMQLTLIAVIFIVGIGVVFNGTTKVIEETTDVLKDRTGLAGGFLQSFGTAFPDMIIGVVAALLSLQLRASDPARAIDLAILAAAATFGSNIHNIIHATWCVFRQNLANKRHREVLMFPPFATFGKLQPIESHLVQPTTREMDGAIHVLTSLTFLTSFVAITMVSFGKVPNGTTHIVGDLYKLIFPIGILLLLLCIGVLYLFRKSHRPELLEGEELEEERYYDRQSTFRIWLDLILSGISILFAAEAMVVAMEILSHLAHIPFVVTGVCAGIIGCLGEMIIVHNFSVNPKGRIGDAIVGVAMDNVVTMLGASFVALLGGIFLGGSSLILIFILILASNTFLIQQISEFKNSLSHKVPAS